MQRCSKPCLAHTVWGLEGVHFERPCARGQMEQYDDSVSCRRFRDADRGGDRCEGTGSASPADQHLSVSGHTMGLGMVCG